MAPKPTYEELEQRIKDLERACKKSKQAEQNLKEKEKHFRLILEAIPEPVIVYGADRLVTYINHSFEKTFGWTREELVGEILEFTTPDEEEVTRDAWLRTLAGENVSFETKRLTKDGRVINTQVQTAILRDHEGNHTTSIIIHRDITERKKAEIERERLISELQQALAEVKTLSGFIPICASCKKIRDDQGFWNQIEAYIQERSDARFSHGMCPDCVKKWYPGVKIPKG